MKFIPFGPRALVRPIAEEVSKKSGIMMPDTAKEKPIEGEILALGQIFGKLANCYEPEDEKNTTDREAAEATTRVMTLINNQYPKVGDRVLFGKYAGSPIKIDGEDLLIMHIDELLGRMEGNKTYAQVVHDDIEDIKKRGGTPKHPWPPKKEKASRGKK